MAKKQNLEHLPEMPESTEQFDNIQIPEVLLAGMYEKSLVIIEESGVSRSTSGKREPSSEQKLDTPEALLPTPTAMPEPEMTPYKADVDISWLGSFAAEVLILVHEPGVVHLNEQSLVFLTKVLGAVKLSLEQVAIVNLARYPDVPFSYIETALPARVALFFGIEPASIGVPMRFPQFQVQPWGGRIFLYAPGLVDMNGSSQQQTDQKRQLWESLKKIF